MKKLEVFNFQSHKETVLEFAPGPNLIVGYPEQGKTALLRALGWVVSNNLRGDYFRSWWGGTTRVVLTLSDGTVIERRRSNSENCYVLNGSVFSAVGSDVPDAVAKVLRIDPIFNFQNQHDSVFLLSGSSGEAARMFNRAVNLDVIDFALSNIGQTARTVQHNLEQNTQQISRLREELSKLSWIRPAEELLSRMEQVPPELKLVQDRLAVVIDLKEQLRVINDSITKLSVIVQADKKIQTLLKLHSEIINLQKTKARLENLKEQICAINDSITKLSGIIRAGKQIQDLTALYNELIDVQKLRIRLEKWRENYCGITEDMQQNEKLLQTAPTIVSLLSLLETIGTTGKRLDELISFGRTYRNLCLSLSEATGELSRLSAQFREVFPKVCPLCGRSG